MLITMMWKLLYLDMESIAFPSPHADGITSNYTFLVSGLQLKNHVIRGDSSIGFDDHQWSFMLWTCMALLDEFSLKEPWSGNAATGAWYTRRLHQSRFVKRLEA